MLALLLFAVYTALAIWVIFFHGAELLEGSLLAALTIDPLAPFLTARLLKAYVLFGWLAYIATYFLTRPD